MLTTHQEEKLGEILHLILNENKKRITIKGSAGVGKTYLVQELLKRLKTSGIRGLYYITAPTHKALAVLKGKVAEETHIVFKTVHSALNLVRQVNFETGEEDFVPAKTMGTSPFQSAGLCVIDEASMLPSKLMSYIKNHPNLLVIFIGDEKQLPPVKEDISPIFAEGYPEVELTEIIRQGEGNPIIELSRNLGWVKGNTDYLIEKEQDLWTGFTYTRDKQKVIDALAKVNGSDEIKYLAWTNSDVDSINKLVRQQIYGTPAKVELGEVLVMSKPYGELFTNQEVRVSKLEIKEVQIPVPTSATKFKYGSIVSAEGTYDLLPVKLYIINGWIRVLHEDSTEIYRKTSAMLKTDCKEKRKPWPCYYWFTEQLAQITYNHAITIHKSQGSTYKKAILHIQNINFNTKPIEKAKLLYTAVTRASDIVILYNN